MAKGHRKSDAQQEAVIEVQPIPVGDIFPNPWNVNSMAPADFEKLKRSLVRYGLPFPVVVRAHPWEAGRWQVVDGEHRWRAATELGWATVHCTIVDYDDETAKEAGIVLNGLRGSPDETKLGSLLRELAAKRDEQELREVMPFDRTRFDELMGELTSVDYERLEKMAPNDDGGRSETYVERVFRMPREVAEVVDEAVGKIRSAEAFEHDWQALEVMAADAMAS
jgi:ParB-like chromosome segregation protein Spo0J